MKSITNMILLEKPYLNSDAECAKPCLSAPYRENGVFSSIQTPFGVFRFVLACLLVIRLWFHVSYLDLRAFLQGEKNNLS